jgi:calcineurin-like phosphoesterase family protein
MSKNIFFISDTHFGHEACCTKFLGPDNVSPLRPFSCAAEADEAMVERWNARVKPGDRVYHLGDIAMSHKHLPILARLNGNKVLIKGNHDTAKLSQYILYFDDIRGSHQFDGMLLTHIPTHPDSLSRWGFNVHGHTHANSVMLPKTDDYQYFTIKDPRYFCVSVEQINYTPISLEEVKKHKPALELQSRIR